MSFLKRHANEEEVDSSGDNEELYERLFPKIGRDFVYKEDIMPLLEIMLSLLDPTGTLVLNLRSDNAAKAKALEYKERLKTGKTKPAYQDLINLDD